MSEQVSDLLALAGAPARDLQVRLRSLPPGMQVLHQRVLSHLAKTGQGPSQEQLAGWATEVGVALPSAVTELADAELLFTDSAGDVIGGVPFAEQRTAHQVRIGDGPVVSANCAIDALGISAMLGADTDVTSVDPHTGEKVTANSRDGQWSWQPPAAVVFIGSAGPGRVTDTCCPVINFFTTTANALTYQQDHHLQGTVLTFSEAVLAGKAAFGDMLTFAMDTTGHQQ